MKSDSAQSLDEVLTKTREFHANLAKSLDIPSNGNVDPRAELLVNYLKDHELKLSKALKTLQSSANKKDLNTWFYEYAKPENILRCKPSHKPFSRMTTDEIMEEVSNQHQQVIEIFRYMYGRAGGTNTGELLRELIELEQTETNMMMYEGARVEEI